MKKILEIFLYMHCDWYKLANYLYKKMLKVVQNEKNIQY